jgi:tetratricopeptide (TPR) repeat protein
MRSARLAGLILAALTACDLRPALKSPANGGNAWRVLTSEHFALYTDAEPADARRELGEFEAIRNALETVAFPPSGSGEPRVSVVFFTRRGDYEALAPQETNGFVAPHLWLDLERQPTILVAGDAKESARRTFVHEEVHELMHRAFGNTPMWLNEGLADYFSSLRIEGNLVVLGDVVPERAIPPDLVPSALEVVRADRRVFSVEESGTRTVAEYYAGAWLLVHLLRNGPQAYRRRFDALADALNAGQTGVEAWNVAMKGILASRLEDDFRAHIRATTWPLYGEHVDPPPPSAIAERVMRPAEVHLLWARLAQPRDGDRSLASREIDEATALEPDSAEVAYIRGCAAMAAHAKADAATAFQAALARSPGEPRFLYGLALATDDCGSAASGVTDPKLCDALAAAAHSPEQNGLAAAYLARTGHVDDALQRAKQAYRADGRCVPCTAILAELLAAKGDVPRAIAVLEQSLSASAETPQDRALATMLEKFRLRGAPRPSPPVDEAPVATSIETPGLCPSECAGQAPATLIEALSTRAAATRSCYEQALGERAELRGKSRVAVRVAGDGRVCAVRIVSSEMPASMNTCVLQIFGGDGYPRPAGGCVEVTIPIAFAPEDAATGAKRMLRRE